MTILWDAYRSALGSIAQAVGRTPLVTLNRVTAGVTPPIHLKLEWYGATGSLKDRIYLHMYERAEARAWERLQAVLDGSVDSLDQLEAELETETADAS